MFGDTFEERRVVWSEDWILILIALIASAAIFLFIGLYWGKHISRHPDIVAAVQPQPATSPVVQPEAPKPVETVKITPQTGDTFSWLCQTLYGNGKRNFWEKIAGIMGLKDPNRIIANRPLMFPKEVEVTKVYHAGIHIPHVAPGLVEPTPPPLPSGKLEQYPPSEMDMSVRAEGDTVQELVHDLYGENDPQTVEAALKVVLYNGERIFFPRTLNVNGRVLKAVSMAEAEEHWNERHHPVEQETAQFPVSVFNMNPIQPKLVPATLTVPAEMPQPMKDPTGYAITIPKDTAKGMPHKRELQTCLVLLARNQQQCDLTAWATPEKNGDVLLKVSLTYLPDEPYKLAVARKKGYTTLDGEDFFSKNATPFYGKFPHRKRMSVFLRETEGIGTRGGIYTLMSGNPIVGAGMGFGPPIAKFLVPRIVRLFSGHHKEEK